MSGYRGRANLGDEAQLEPYPPPALILVTVRVRVRVLGLGLGLGRVQKHAVGELVGRVRVVAHDGVAHLVRVRVGVRVKEGWG